MPRGKHIYSRHEPDPVQHSDWRDPNMKVFISGRYYDPIDVQQAAQSNMRTSFRRTSWRRDPAYHWKKKCEAARCPKSP
jgi:hypothetical protein